MRAGQERNGLFRLCVPDRGRLVHGSADNADGSFSHRLPDLIDASFGGARVGRRKSRPQSLDALELLAGEKLAAATAAPVVEVHEVAVPAQLGNHGLDTFSILGGTELPKQVGDRSDLVGDHLVMTE